MSARTYMYSVSIVKNTKGEIALKRDDNGNFSAQNAEECYKTMLQLAKAKKLPINKYSLFIADGGTEVVLLANRYGNPYIAVLPKKATPQGKRGIEKLA